jgi:hypothetical protein
MLADGKREGKERKIYPLRERTSWMLVTRACNPSYSGGRDQEDCSLKPAWVGYPITLHKSLSYHKKGLVE